MVKVNPKKNSSIVTSYFQKNPFLSFIIFAGIVTFVLFPLLFFGSIRQYSLPSDRLSTLKKEGITNGENGQQLSTMQLEVKMSAPTILDSGKSFIIYGTAWKKDDTARLVSEAIESGFRFFDTACQPKHYNEAGVGDGWIAVSEKMGITRDDLFFQTKFTPHKKDLTAHELLRIPYDVEAELEDQVKQAFQKSLEHLKTTYLDSFLVHMKNMEETIRVWRVFESLYDQGLIKHLGLSNMYELSELQQLYNIARIKPTLLQNRFHSKTNFDSKIREFCKLHNIIYQSFWTLTANRRALATAEISKLAKRKDLTPQTLMYAFMMTLGHTPLDGTTSKSHMIEDVDVMKRILNGEEILNTSELKFMANIIGL